MIEQNEKCNIKFKKIEESQKIIKQYSDLFDKLNNAARVVNEVTLEVKDFSESMISIYNKIQEYAPKILYILENIDFDSISCAEKLYEIGWLPCIDLTSDENKKIADILDKINEENINNARDIIFKSYNDEKLDYIYNLWKENNYINKERFPFLREAIDNYKNSRYASCVALITCHYGGIIEEMNEYINSIPELKIKVDERKKLQRKEKIELENINLENINAEDLRRYKRRINDNINKMEKYKAERLYSLNFNYMTMMFSDYIKKYVYCKSKDSKENIPNRNGICHGSLLNYNTQEHALKSILIIDSLIRLYIFIDLE